LFTGRSNPSHWPSGLRAFLFPAVFGGTSKPVFVYNMCVYLLILHTLYECGTNAKKISAIRTILKEKNDNRQVINSAAEKSGNVKILDPKTSEYIAS